MRSAHQIAGAKKPVRKRTLQTLGFRFPLPRAGESQGEGVSGRSCHQRGALTLALSQRERERRPKHWLSGFTLRSASASRVRSAHQIGGAKKPVRKRTLQTLGFRFPLPRAGEGQGEGVLGRSCHQRDALTLALSQRERES